MSGEPNMPAVFAVIATLVFPGAGHLLLRRYLRGAVIAGLFAASADVLLLVAFRWDGGMESATVRVAFGALAALWVYALADLLLRLKTTHSKEFRPRKDALLHQAQIAWMKNDHDQAERLIRDILRMDERDVAAWVHLGKVQKSRGCLREMRRSFRAALNLDDGEAWHWDLSRELGLIDVRESKAESS